eukprot:GHVU01170495.1.p2 GENE.GHVU01170495.1~~GHVU01170495.1.p2  ORF type:complete len:118 (+),score=18.46 GHVU01170495.1:40-393(+)
MGHCCSKKDKEKRPSLREEMKRRGAVQMSNRREYFVLPPDFSKGKSDVPMEEPMEEPKDELQEEPKEEPVAPKKKRTVTFKLPSARDDTKASARKGRSVELNNIHYIDPRRQARHGK